MSRAIMEESVIKRRRRGESRRNRRGVQFTRLESLERRALLASATYSFVPPTLGGLLHQPNPTPGVYNRLVGSLQAQVTIGPLADLRDPKGATSPPKIDGDQYVADVAQMVQGFEATAAQVQPNNALLNRLVRLQGDAFDAQVVSLNSQRKAGLISTSVGSSAAPGTTSNFYNANLTTVEQLTMSRPLWSYGTPFLNYINRTENFENDLATFVKTLSPAGSPSLSITTADHLAHDSAASFLADIHLATLQKPTLAGFMDQQVGTLLTRLDAAAASGPAGAGAFGDAVRSFVTATYDPQTGAGYLGPHGAYGRHFAQPTVGDLPYSITNTFANGNYRTVTLARTTVYHRNFTDLSAMKGRFVTKSLYPNSAVAIRKSALDQIFQPPNLAFYVADVSIPAGSKVYVGLVAPIYQGLLTPRNTLYPGLGSQVFVPASTAFGQNTKYQNQRTTGT